MKSLLDCRREGPAIVFAAVALLMPLAALGQTAGDPAAFDIAGVKLGMDPDEATEALQTFDPALEVSRQYLHGGGLSYGLVGKNLDDFPLDERSTIYLNNLVAKKGGPKQVCTPPPGVQCFDRYDEDSEVVTVWFSRTPGQERVIAIARDKTFRKEPKPSIASLKSGVFAKYPEPQPTFTFRNGWTEVVGWLFDGKQQLISAATARSKGMRKTGGLPQFAKPGDGLGLNATFVSTNTNAPIAEQFSVDLYDATALFKSYGDSKAAAAALQAKADAKQLERSNKGAAPTKF